MVMSGLLVLLMLVMFSYTKEIRVATSKFNLLVCFVPSFWLALVFMRLRPKLQFAKSSFLLLALQAWAFVASAVVAEAAVKELQLDDQAILYWTYFTVYALTATLVWIYPKTRLYVARAIIPIVTIDALVSVAQYFKVGIALRIQDYYFPLAAASRDMLLKFTGNHPRVSGFHPAQSSAGVFYAVAFFLIGMRLFYRKLYIWEWVLLPLFLFCIVATQVRTILIPLALGCILMTVYIVKRYQFKSAILAFLAAGIGFALRNRIKFGYLNGDQSTLRWRVHVAWPQAYKIYAEFPITGIGMDARLAYSRFPSKTTVFDRWVTWGALDSSYLHVLAVSGIVGVAIFALFALLAFAGLVKISLDKSQSAERRSLALASVAVFGILLFLLGTFEDFYWKESMMLPIILFGLAGPTPEELRNSLNAMVRKKGIAPRTLAQAPAVG
jgi:hypothetical protein